MRILFIPGGPEDATDARVERPARYLASRGHFVMADASHFWLDEEIARGTQLVVLQRPTQPEHLEVLRSCRRAGICTVVDMDVPVPQSTAIPEGWDTDLQPNPAAMQACLREADLVTASSQALGDQLRRQASKLEVLPDGFDDRAIPWQTARARRATLMEEAPDAGDGRTIWFAVVGRETDYPDVAAQAGAIDQALMAGHGNGHAPSAGAAPAASGLLVIGDPILHDAFTQLPYERRRTVDLPDAEELPRALAEADVLLVPLASTPFSRLRSPRRVIEASGLGLPLIASQTPATAALISSGQNGFLARSAADWQRHVATLSRSAEERARCGWSLLSSVGQMHAWSALIERWETAFQGAVAARGR